MSFDVEDIQKNWLMINQRLSIAASKSNRCQDEISIVAVSKTHSIEKIISALKAGIMLFGENYAQEMNEKHLALLNYPELHPEWHFIGHLQTNKVKYIVSFVSMIHSVDSVKLAKEISEQAEKRNRTVDILLQVNTSGEKSKYGCKPDEIYKLYEEIYMLKGINILGLMTIGTFAIDAKISRREFSLLRNVRDNLNEKYKISLKHLSMGMTHDYEIAVEEGATLVRIGTAIFGERKTKI
jgi:hypothetical protein